MSDTNNSPRDTEVIEMSKISPEQQEDVELESMGSQDKDNENTKQDDEDHEEIKEEDVIYNSEKPVGFRFGLSKVFFHSLYLLEKNFKLYLRGWLSTLIQLFSPVAIVFLLFILSLIVTAVQSEDSYSITNPIPVNTETLKPCQPGPSGSCYTLAFSTDNNTFARKVMDDIVREYELESDDVREFDSEQELLNFIASNPNVTQTAVSFNNNTQGLDRNFTAPSQSGDMVQFQQVTDSATRYTIWYNATDPNQGESDVGIFVVEFQQIIDSTIVFLHTGERQSIQTNKEGLPQRPQAADGQALIFGQTGPQFFSLAASISLVVSMQLLSTEKESMLRFGMSMMGMSTTAYWISWIITFTLMSVGTSLATIISGYIFQIHFFLRANFLSLFLLFFIFSVSFNSVALMFSTLTNRGRTALIFGFMLLAVTFILNQFLASQEFVIVLYSPVCGDVGDQFCVEDWVRAIRILLYFYPPFNFAKMFTDINQATASVYDSVKEEYVAPETGYTVSAMFEKVNITNTFNIDNLPASYESLLLLIMNIVLYGLIGLYLDCVLNNNTGVQYKPWFFLKPSFWGLNCFSSKKKVSSSTARKSEEELADLDEDVRKEYDRVRDENEDYLLRVLNVEKKFKTNFGLPFISDQVDAVNGVDFGVRPGMVLGILGANGSGKSTTINQIIGLLKPTSGEIIFNGKSVVTNVGYIRSNLGICPQFDILFEKLTAWEHLKLYGSIKGMSRNQIKREAKERLKQVDLYKVRNKKAGSYSGGMKRRLSLSISTIGSPSIIMLDECTSGLDVDVRRRIWKLIHTMQSEDRIILMTTHSMEEAEALSNQIIIMQSGRILAIGNTLQLKQKYGAGYNLSVICYEDKFDETLAMVAKELPQATLTSANAGNLVFNVLPEYIVNLGYFIKKLEHLSQFNAEEDTQNSSNYDSSGTSVIEVKESDKTHKSEDVKIDKDALKQYHGLIKDWGISFTTLERVFLKLTDQSSQMGLKDEDNESKKATQKFERLKGDSGSGSNHSSRSNTPSYVEQPKEKEDS